MKRFLLFLLPCVLLCPSLLRASTYTAASCSSSDFATALSSATDGDTVQGPSGGGSASWSSTITINKGVTLNGNGCSVTFGSSDLIVNTDSTPFSLTGFTFNSCGSTNVQINTASGPPYKATWRIYNNTFSVGGTCLQTYGLGPGLVDHNTFTTSAEAAEMIHIWGGPAGNTTGWTVDITPGGPNMIYFENNIWTETDSSNYAQAEEGYYGAAFVLRDNTLNYVQGDAHGTGEYGPETRWVELYNNTFNNCCASGSFFDFRGGSGMIWGNTANNTRGGTETRLGPICGSSDGCSSYPMQYGYAMGIDGTNSSPVYLWGTSAVDTNPANRDSSLLAIGSSAGTCSGLLGTLCNVITGSTQPATLQRCESAADVSAGCPVSYAYTPYPYPHPLDNCSPSQQGAGATCNSNGPAPPTALNGSVQTQ